MLMFCAAVFVAVMLLGGCGGGNSGNGSQTAGVADVYVFGALPDDVAASMTEAGINIKPGGEANIANMPADASLLFPGGEVMKVAKDGAVADKMRSSVLAGGDVTLLSADKKEMDYLCAELLEGKVYSTPADSAEIFAVGRGINTGDFESFVWLGELAGEPEATSEDIDGGTGAVKSGDLYILTVGSNDHAGEYKTLTVENSKISLSGKVNGTSDDVDIDGAADDDNVYYMSGDVVVIEALEKGEDEDDVVPELENTSKWEYLFDWLADTDDETADSAELQKAADEMSVKAASNGDSEVTSADLKKLAMRLQPTMTGSLNDKGVKSTLSIITVHKFSENGAGSGRDYYYISHESSINGGQNYRKTKRKRGQGYSIENYMVDFSVEPQIVMISGDVNKLVSLSNAQPTAINSTTEYTWSHGWNLGGSFGFNGGASEEKGVKAEGAASLTWGVSSSYAEKGSTQDISGGLDNKNNVYPRWRYNYREPEQNADGSYRRKLGLDREERPAGDLSRNTFTCYGSWVWDIDSTNREKIKGYKIHVEATTGTLSTKNFGSIGPTRKKDTYSSDLTDENSKSVGKLPMAPLFAVDQPEVEFTKAAASKTLAVSSEGEWEVIGVDSGKDGDTAGVDWCTAEKHLSGTKMDISVTANDTGKLRQARVKIKRTSGISEGPNEIKTKVIYVTQQPN